MAFGFVELNCFRHMVTAEVENFHYLQRGTNCISNKEPVTKVGY